MKHMNMTENKEEPKKRGRRKKIVENDVEKCLPSKIMKQVPKMAGTELAPQKSMNVILHLKCTVKDIENYIRFRSTGSNDIQYNPNISEDIVPFDGTFLEHNNVYKKNDDDNMISQKNNAPPSSHLHANFCPRCDCPLSKNINTSQSTAVVDDFTEKIKSLKVQYYKNEIPDKKVDCFWCTYPFDNDPFYILQQGTSNDILGHGSFCSPPCAVAFLFKNMNWDDSAKIDSYQLMNYKYTSPTQNNNQIKPACSPFYFLDKYLGNLSIQEFRKLSNSNCNYLCIDKPVTRILPEIHEESDKSASTGIRGNYKVKKQSEKKEKENRNDIIKNNFGI